MNLYKMNVSDIIVSHLEKDDRCFHIRTTVPTNSKYLRNSPLYVSEKKELYGVSFSLYKSMLNHKIKECYVIEVPGVYDERFDFYLHNTSCNITLFYYNIKNKYPDYNDLFISEFDLNQIDLMYSVRLEQKLDEIMVDESVLEVKRDYKITLVLKTLEDNAKIQKALFINKSHTHKNDERKKELTIDYDYFKRICIDKKPPIVENKLFEEEQKEHIMTPFPCLIIECVNINQMNSVLDFLKINKEKQKTTRIKFKRVEKMFR